MLGKQSIFTIRSGLTATSKQAPSELHDRCFPATQLVETSKASHRKIYKACTPDEGCRVAKRLRVEAALVGGKLVVVRAVIWFNCSVLQRADEGWRIGPRSYAACTPRIAGVIVADVS
jgi:hypothetical protein